MGKLTELKIESFNCNSIGKFNKRNQLFSFLKKKDANILILVDTRIDPSIENTVKSEWGAQCFFSSLSSQQRGVAIFFQKGFTCEVKWTKKDNAGNLLQVAIHHDNQDILIPALYGPNTDPSKQNSSECWGI